MKKYILLFTHILLFGFCSVSGQNYSVALIPDNLKANANCVVREFTRRYELSSVNSGTLIIKKVITVLEKEGDSNADMIVQYDRNSTVSIKEIIIYDSNGKKVKSVKQSDIKDYPAFGPSELYSEDRVKYYDADHSVYPYTVSYEYELRQNNIISYGAWIPVTSYNISVQRASFTFTHPSDVDVNKKEINISSKNEAISDNKVTEIWEVGNLEAIEEEPMDIRLSEQVPSVYLMPAKLIYDKYEGNAATWGEFGKWIYSLYQGRDQLSEAEKGKIDILVKDIPDTLGRIKAIYKYMQDRTRYVAVTLGIGGFQPFDAKTVFETGYGDCKALSNYMSSLLKYTGIKSYPALVAAGRYKVPVFTDFPNFLQFNHVILCVPLRKDTIWLECTDQKIPFGFLGSFTDDRDALLINSDNGTFAHTSKYDVTDNLRICSSEFQIDSLGTASCIINTFMKGLQYDNITGFLGLNYSEQSKWLYSNSSLPSLQLLNFSIEEDLSPIPSVKISESSVSKNFCSFTGNYMLLPLNQINVQPPLKKMLKQRNSDVLISRSFVDYDTLKYKIPKNFSLESVPVGSTINSVFGSYSWAVSGNETEITYIRKLVINEGRYRPSAYKDLYEFILSVSKADNTKVILTKKM